MFGLIRTQTNTLDIDSATSSAYISSLPASSKAEPTAMEVDEGLPSAPTSTPSKPPTSEPLPEVDTYVRLLLILYLIDTKENDKAIQVSLQTAEKIHSLNRRTLDPIAAKVFFYLARVHEITDRLAEIRP